MGATLLQKRTSTPGAVPTLAQILDGQWVINLNDGVAFLTKNVSGVRTVLQFADISKVFAKTETIPATSGGTGQTAYAVGDLLYANTTTTLAKLGAGTAGQVLTANGAGVAPSWQAAGASAGVSSFNTRTGAVTLASADVTTALGFTPANKAGENFTGAASFSAGTDGEVQINGGVGSLEIGKGGRAVASTPFIDFHSSAGSPDYDARIIASGGSATIGQGTLNVQAAAFQFNGNNILSTLASVQGVFNAGTGNTTTLQLYKHPAAIGAGSYIDAQLELKDNSGLAAGWAGIGFHRDGLTAMTLYHAGGDIRNILRIIDNGGNDYGVVHTGYPAFSAVLSAVQSFTSATATKVLFNTKEFDQSNSYDAVNSRFVAPVAGIYSFDVKLAFGIAAASQYVALYKNSVEVKMGHGELSSGAAYTVGISCMLSLAAGDAIEVVCYQNAGGSLSIIGAASRTWFCGRLVNPS